MKDYIIIEEQRIICHFLLLICRNAGNSLDTGHSVNKRDYLSIKDSIDNVIKF